MAQLGYDIIAHDGGWAIMLTPGRGDAFPTQKVAFDKAAELTRKLRFVGYPVDVRGRHGGSSESVERDKPKARADAA
jgi:hypothetical protein